MPSPTIRHVATVVAGHPTDLAIATPSRRFRSSVPSSSPTSTISVLSSMTSSEPDRSCQASRSTIPRSPHSENDTSGRTTQPPIRCNRAITASASAACLTLSRRSRSAPRERVSSSTRTSRAAATATSVPSEISWIAPRSMRETTLRETPAAAARSACRHLRRIRAARITAPNRRASTPTSLAAAALVRLNGTPVRYTAAKARSWCTTRRAAWTTRSATWTSAPPRWKPAPRAWIACGSSNTPIPQHVAQRGSIGPQHLVFWS